jgi:tetratricopeptide (TPR) repeat protein
MEFLKKYKNVFILTALITISYPSTAQDNNIQAFRESYALENSREYRKAVERLKAVYSEDSYEINLRLGWLCYQASMLNESMEFYNKAVALKPYAIEPKFGLAYPLSALGRWNEIISLYNKILETDPQNTLANYRLGAIYYAREDFAKADVYVEKVVNLYPFDYDAVVLLAWIKLRLQKHREAKVLFQKALMFKPDDISAMEGLKQIK